MTTHTASADTLGARFETLTANWRTALERRRVYKQTLNELSALSNRELADLGLHRSQLRGIAWQAAYEG
ncbi:hypothetical protein OCH239_13695 [Roseivivax halodurans JCM 10272]|uniref:YjiS-like domain-containing protein n=1 Tax=Roseivivax halodurans JCM 10272 TaxID=1449350 RepID=X7ECY1_9RHOB|nr:DUF1127 domain-containing protein [Roseivivax halodurans]ETX13061.1 hypothetical protein OCH239_13695 [Roseivivax halodurans JCM 10272]